MGHSDGEHVYETFGSFVNVVLNSHPRKTASNRTRNFSTSGKYNWYFDTNNWLFGKFQDAIFVLPGGEAQKKRRRFLPFQLPNRPVFEGALLFVKLSFEVKFNRNQLDVVRPTHSV